MNRVPYSIVIIILLPLIGITGADEDDEETQPLQLAVELSDGSCVIGIPSSDSLLLRTSFAGLDIPIALIRSAHFKDDDESSHIGFWNGDKLSGVIEQDSLTLTTVFGEVTLVVEDIRRLRHFASPHLNVADAARVVKFRNKQFLYVKQWMTWQAAANWCKDRGASLACIGDAEENEVVCQLVRREDPKKSFWAGGTDHDREGQ